MRGRSPSRCRDPRRENPRSRARRPSLSMRPAGGLSCSWRWSSTERVARTARHRRGRRGAVLGRELRGDCPPAAPAQPARADRTAGHRHRGEAALHALRLMACDRLFLLADDGAAANIDPGRRTSPALGRRVVPSEPHRALQQPAWTKAWGQLPRIWRCVTSYSSESSPGGPHAARLRSNHRPPR